MSLNIREAAVVDVPRIVEIWNSGAFLANGVKPTDTQTQYLSRLATETILASSDTPSRIWIADNSGTIVGWQSLLPCRPNPFFHHLHFESSTYTQRRSGIVDLGSKLLLNAVRFADEAPIDMVLGFVMENNFPSIRMMKRCGFQRVGAMPLAAEAAVSSREIWYYDATAERTQA